MKHLLAKALIYSAVAFPAFSAFAAPETYVLDPKHTNITWHADHFGFSSPSGKFVESEGVLILDEENPQNSTVKVMIKPASVLTGLKDFDKHLRSEDFLDVENFPKATFVSDKVEVTGEDAAKVHGTLTLLGVAKPVVLDVRLNKIGEDRDGVKTAGFSAATTIQRSDFGMDYALPGVSDEVRIDIETEANLEEPK